MSDGAVQAELLAAIRAEPDADAPRLVYADWCDVHGDPDRANLIRVQIERAHLPSWDVRQVGLRVQEEALLDANLAAWKEELPTIDGVTWGSFDRGFVAEAAVEEFDQLEKAWALLGQTTGLAHLEAPWPTSAEQAQALRPIPGLRGLTIHRALREPRAAGWLASAPFLQTLHEIVLKDEYSPTPCTEDLLTSPYLTGLRSIRLERRESGREGIPAVVAEGRFAHLETLRLVERGDDSWDDLEGGAHGPTLAQLGRWPGLAGVRTLDLSGPQVTGEALRPLLQSPFVADLHRLDLTETIAGRGEDLPLEQAHPDLRLEALALDGGLFFGVDEPRWVDAPCLSALRELSLGVVDVEEAALLSRLLEAPFTSGLQILEVGNAELGSARNAYLDRLAAASLPALHTLDVGRILESGHRVERFLESSTVESLHSLDFSGVRVKPAVAEALTRSPCLGRLERLCLNASTAPSVRQIIAASVLGQRLQASGGLRFVRRSR